MNVIYTNAISVDDYNNLRLSAGWSAIEPEQAQAGLSGSAFITAANDGDKTIGVGRLVWDGGYAALIKDVLVLPEYQGMGIGMAMMEQIMSFLKQNMKPGWGVSVDLMAAIGKEGFYEKFGFVSRPLNNRGAGMDMWVVKEKETNSMEQVIIRDATISDIDRILAQFIAQNDNKPREVWETYGAESARS